MYFFMLSIVFLNKFKSILFIGRKNTTKKASTKEGFFITSLPYFNNKLLIRLMYSAGSSGKPPSAINA